MDLDPATCYAALRSRDPRFDGLFFVGVRTTGIYCRPVCPARLPRKENCTFFGTAAAAEQAGYRACLRCRPELAPGNASVDARSRLARAALARIDAGFLDERSVGDLASELSVSPRHLRRTLRAELGVSPVELAQTRRLALAKQLLQDTRLPVTQVAYTSGFSSLRRFNALFRKRFSRPPSALRRRGGRPRSGDRSPAEPGRSRPSAPAPAETLTLRLDYRPPLAWETVLGFVGTRATEGVEVVRDGVYRRWVALGKSGGWVTVDRMEGRPSLRVGIPLPLARHAPTIVAGMRRVFDLDARPDVIDGHLERDPRLRPLVTATPGLRVPGAFDPFELAVRAVLGQQISVSAATRLAGRLVARLGSGGRDPGRPGPDGSDGTDRKEPDSGRARGDRGERRGGGIEAGRTFPSPSTLAGRSVDEIRAIGMPGSRARTVIELSRAVCEGRVELEVPADPDAAEEALRSVPGIGPWTAQYILMRALRWPNAFPSGDLGLRKALGASSAGESAERAREWEPWRSYGAMHLWNDPNSGGT